MKRRYRAPSNRSSPSRPPRKESGEHAQGTVAPADTKKMATGAMILGQVGVFLILVAFPAFFTAASPLSVTHFHRAADGSVSAHASTRLLYLVPYRQTRVEGVTTVSDRFSEGSVNRRRTGGSVSSEDHAYLIIEGTSGAAQVEVSPANIDSVVARAQRFLDDPSQSHLRLITVANWKFGVFAAGLASILTLVYLFMLAVTVQSWLRRLTGRGAAPTAP